MQFFLPCMAVVLLASSVELSMSSRRTRVSVPRSFQACGISPEYIPVPPNDLCEAYFDDITVTLGSEVCPEYTINAPTIAYNDPEPSCLYTVMILDTTFPYPNNTYGSPYLLALYINVVDICDYLNTGYALAEYCPQFLVPGTGPKTMCIVMYRQANEISTAGCLEQNCFNNNRYQFCPTEFASNYTLCDPCAGTYYTVPYTCYEEY